MLSKDKNQINTTIILLPEVSTKENKNSMKNF